MLFDVYPFSFPHFWQPVCVFLFVTCDLTGAAFDWQEYIRRQLEEEQRHLEILQQQLLHEQAMLLVSVRPWITIIILSTSAGPVLFFSFFSKSTFPWLYFHPFLSPKWFRFNVPTTPRLLKSIIQVLIIPPLHKVSWELSPFFFFWDYLVTFLDPRGAVNSRGQNT